MQSRIVFEAGGEFVAALIVLKGSVWYALEQFFCEPIVQLMINRLMTNYIKYFNDSMTTEK